MTWQRSNVLITGCTGFLGAQLTEALLNLGANVVGLVRDHTPPSEFTKLKNRVRAIVPGSVEDLPVVTRAINEYDIDTVFHLAAQAVVGAGNRGPLSTFETNIRGTWVVLEACRTIGTIKRVVLASSDKAYGQHTALPYDERHALQGQHPYDVSKSCADLIGHTYFHTYRLPISITRCGNLFGPGDLNFSRIVPGSMSRILTGHPPILRTTGDNATMPSNVTNDGTPVRDYIFVGDVVNGYIMLAEQMLNSPSATLGHAFNFGTGRPLSARQMIEIILDVSGTDLKPVIEEGVGEINAQFLSSTLARNVLGWQPQSSIKDQLRMTWEWYKARLRDDQTHH